MFGTLVYHVRSIINLVAVASYARVRGTIFFYWR